jgi:hypothetical protein
MSCMQRQDVEMEAIDDDHNLPIATIIVPVLHPTVIAPRRSRQPGDPGVPVTSSQCGPWTANWILRSFGYDTHEMRLYQYLHDQAESPRLPDLTFEMARFLAEFADRSSDIYRRYRRVHDFFGPTPSEVVETVLSHYELDMTLLPQRDPQQTPVEQQRHLAEDINARGASVLFVCTGGHYLSYERRATTSRWVRLDTQEEPRDMSLSSVVSAVYAFVPVRREQRRRPLADTLVVDSTRLAAATNVWTVTKRQR